MTFYGGEPLLNIEGIKYSLQKAEEMKDDKELLEYSAGIITNGTLINEEVIDLINKYPIGYMQITLDGPKDIHDSRRVKVNGEGTFDEIIGNIKQVAEKVENDKFKLGIRINVDKLNIDRIPELLLCLKREVPQDNITISFGIIRQGINTCGDISTICLSREELKKALWKLWTTAWKMGFKVYTRPFPKFFSCTFDALNGFVIDPYLKVYPCWELVGLEEFSIGQLTEDGKFVPTPLFYETKTRNALEIPECKKCKLLPICMGGCAVEALKLNGNFNKSGCFSKRYDYDIGLLHYLMRRYKNVICENDIWYYLNNVWRDNNEETKL
ncbi:radical SAM/SPASM domain-containing protein [Thermococcus barophilus]|uniref:radical SAM/SPASM domain-containing protein n=1 Tax=Thermococcus barophilus TaxID=55802 RepID=UPI0009E7B0D2|nr:radical SAM protein [Thermococcus barophilus]